MSWKELKNKKHFCPLPFLHMATHTNGATPLCCVAEGTSGINVNNESLNDYWNSDYVKKIRLQMIKDEPVEACRRCYSEEKSGFRSHRIVEMQAWEEKLESSGLDQLLSQVAEDGATSSMIRGFDLRLGNTCNLQCVMCRPQESSKWKTSSKALEDSLQQESLKSLWVEQGQINSRSYEWYKNPQFWEDLKAHVPHMKEL
ncbi:MAG: SPASM domain-containing protein, partial [Bdellovibrionales bacterium]|nr:SPASM domain-containing protein [Bdellovibrionales bacterium]